MRKARFILALAFVPLCGSVLLSQEVHGLDCSPPSAGFHGVAVIGFLPTPLVRNQPYCATRTEELETRHLNGDIDKRKNVSSVCRNSQGVVRTEMLNHERSGPEFGVPLKPPPMGKSFSLEDTANKQRTTVYPERKFASILSTGPAQAPADDNPAGFATISPDKASASNPPVDGNAPFLGMAYPQPPPVPPTLQDMLPDHIARQHSEHMAEGVAVCDDRTTTTYARGTFDDPKDEQEVSETWYSPYLEGPVWRVSHVHAGHGGCELVFTRHEVRLTDIRLQEPDPALFTIPKDYKVRGPQEH
jgi:hypothetical protein